MGVLYSETAKAFVDDCYGIVGAQNPTVPLHASDNSDGIKIMNQVLQSQSGTSLMITVAKKISFNLAIGEQFITFGEPTYTPTPDVVLGRLTSCQNVWIVLDGVTYPMRVENRNVFYDSSKYFPQSGLPRLAVIDYQTDLTEMEIWPNADQVYTMFIYGKFELSYITANMNMASLPKYFQLYFKYRVAKEIAFRKGREKAWTPKLEKHLLDLEKDMVAVSPINLTVQTNVGNFANGAYRVRSGI